MDSKNIHIHGELDHNNLSYFPTVLENGKIKTKLDTFYFRHCFSPPGRNSRSGSHC